MADTWTSSSATYLRPPEGDQRDPWTESTARQGRVGSQRLIEVGEVEPPADVAKALKLTAGQRAVVRRRLILLDDRPVELADSYYPLDIARDTTLAKIRKIKGGALKVLAELGHSPQVAHEDVEARLPTQHESELLALGEHDPVLTLFRVIASHDRPVEVTVMTMTAAGRRLHYDLAIG